MLGDEVDDALLDVGPDRGPLLLTGGRPAEVLLDDLAEGRHVGQGDDHLEVPLLGRLGLDDLDRATAREEPGDLLDRADGRRQADPLRRLGQEGVEPLEAERQVGPALGAGDGVDLVEDDRLDPGEGLPRLGREHEEQRLGSRDEDVGGRARDRPPLLGAGVT